jgi:hypothetical protein
LGGTLARKSSVNPSIKIKSTFTGKRVDTIFGAGLAPCSFFSPSSFRQFLKSPAPARSSPEIEHAWRRLLGELEDVVAQLVQGSPVSCRRSGKARDRQDQESDMIL